MYKLFKFGDEIVGAYKDEGNERTVFNFSSTSSRYYQEYLAWLAEGNEPLPADEPEQPEEN